MPIFIVSVRCPSGRYIDSLWIVSEHAVKRTEDLKAEINRSGNGKVGQSESWNVWWTEASVGDAKLA
jgi:hypothetical protein